MLPDCHILNSALPASWPVGSGTGSVRPVTPIVPPFAAGGASFLKSASFLTAPGLRIIARVCPPSLRALEGRVPAMASKSIAAGTSSSVLPNAPLSSRLRKSRHQPHRFHRILASRQRARQKSRPAGQGTDTRRETARPTLLHIQAPQIRHQLPALLLRKPRPARHPLEHLPVLQDPS